MTRAALVTGAASGIGRGVAEALARAGHPVALLDRQGDLLAEVAEKLTAEGATASAHEVDVTDQASVRSAVDAARAQHGPITIAVTSAGIVHYAATAELALDDWQRVIGVNLTGTFLSLQAVIPDMVEAGWGRIITISSMSAQSGAARMAHYAASKGGVIALTKTLSSELAKNGITANTIPPSLIMTPMVDAMTAAGEFPGEAVIAPHIPVGRAGTVDDIASACLFLVSDQASFITGQTIGVNGGMYV